MYRIPQWITRLLKPWIICSNRKDDLFAVFITFDDGPDPNSTPQILQMLHQYQAEASFFVLGSAALKYPEIISMIRNAGHNVHLHSQDHVRPIFQWPSSFIREVIICRNLLGSSLYRPPYGKVPIWHLLSLLKNKFRVVLWNVDLCDYKPDAPITFRLIKMVGKIKPGDIILLHDQPKFIHNTLSILSILLQDLKKKNLTFEIIR